VTTRTISTVFSPSLTFFLRSALILMKLSLEKGQKKWPQLFPPKFFFAPMNLSSFVRLRLTSSARLIPLHFAGDALSAGRGDQGRVGEHGDELR